MEWKRPSAELGGVLARAIAGFDCQKRIMFGASVYTVNGNMFAGVHGDNIFLRLAGADREAIAAAHAGVAPFEPVKGRVMSEYVTVPSSLYRDAAALHQWLERSYEYVGTLATKKPKPRSR